MADFHYKARDKFSKLLSGVISAQSKEQASLKLKDMGYVPISISRAHHFREIKVLGSIKRVNLHEIATFTRQLYSLQKAGVPLLASLDAIAQQTRNRYFVLVIKEMASDIKGGLSFSQAVSKQAHVFNSIYTSMIKAAEASGTMVEILSRLAGLIEGELDMRQRVKAATRYPLIALFVLCVGFLIVIGFVIPRFAAVYSQFNTLLPLPTRMLIAVNSYLQSYWHLTVLGLVIFVVLFRWFISTGKGRKAWDNYKLRIPLLGQLLTLFIMSRFARVTALLMKSGVPILEVLHLVVDTSGNVVIAQTIDSIAESVNQGKGMSGPMKTSDLFPPLVIQMVAVGEQIGKVDELLLSVADYYDSESSYLIKNLTTYIEPLLIFILATMVLVLALGIFMPMWNLISVFRS